jgi:hypothetical protein
MVATIAGDILAWLLFVGIAVLGVTLTVIGTIRAHRLARARGWSEALSVTLASVAAIVLFLGGWMFLGLWWAGARLQRAARRPHAT